MLLAFIIYLYHILYQFFMATEAVATNSRHFSKEILVKMSGQLGRQHFRNFGMMSGLKSWGNYNSEHKLLLPLHNFGAVLLRILRHMLTYNIDWGEGKSSHRTEEISLVNSWLWKFLRALKMTYESVLTILPEIVAASTFVWFSLNWVPWGNHYYLRVTLFTKFESNTLNRKSRKTRAFQA